MNNDLLIVRRVLFINIFIASLITGLLLAKSSYSEQLTKKDLTRINNEAEVAIRVTFLNPIKKITEEELIFEVRMNSHSVDLDDYKMEESTLLKDDNSNIYKPLGWFNPGGGGHHRFGNIKFSSTGKDGSEIVGKETKQITLLIKGVAGVEERSFKWDFPLR